MLVNDISIDKKILKVHFIPSDEDLWKIENYKDFFVERSKLIWKVWKNF